MSINSRYKLKTGQEVDYDFVVPLKPNKNFRVKAKGISVTKHTPKIIFDQ